MEPTEFIVQFRRMVSSLEGRLDADVCRDVLVYLDTGEEGLAVEFLMGGLIRRRIPVTRDEVATLVELMRHFELSAGDADAADFYTALTDPVGTTAALTVVDGAS